MASSSGTFPESTKALVLEDVSVGLHGAGVATGHTVQVHLGLESNLDHICGLCKGHCHGTRSTASQDTNEHISIWKRKHRNNRRFNITRSTYFLNFQLKQSESLPQIFIWYTFFVSEYSCYFCLYCTYSSWCTSGSSSGFSFSLPLGIFLDFSFSFFP